MATLALTAVGAAAGSALLPSGLTFLGATISGAAIGQAAGAFAGRYVDQALFGSSGQSRIVEGSRLSDLQITASTEGAPIPRVYGRIRLAGQIIWATHFEEEVITSTQSSGGGKGGGGSQSQTVKQIEYRYFANFAVALCEGEITRIGRIWADGKELDLSQVTFRVYRGTEDQLPDSLIEAKQGTGNAPAYRGTAYIVFERLALGRFGNRLPQLNFEIFRAVDDFEKQIRSVTIIPGSGEFAYDSDEITREAGAGLTLSENVHTRLGGSDWDVAIDQLEDSLPNVGSASLIVSWFGSDLRSGQCELRPKVEIAVKTTAPESWSVAGISRQGAVVVSTKDGSPAFGGTPSDASVVSAIQDLKTRGLKVTFNPFILMDIPDGNVLPDPYTGLTGQPVYPWRGRITVDPAPDQAGTPDKTAAAATQLSAFVGSAQVSDYSVLGETVLYSGPVEWSLRRMVLHYAHLCVAAGGVDAFLIGSELRGLSQIRDGAASYPFVDALIDLAADLKTVLGSQTNVSYAADWSEYFGHQPEDGSGDVFFHLDPLWSAADIDAVGIDVYWPLADWRDGETHLDYQAGVRSTHDLGYLKGNIAAGEGFDWFYSSQEDRDSQLRTDITDGAASKPWVFRFKDIKSWWQNQHFNRPGGVESGSPTSWSPESKPIWFTELGCPAVDKGANQPNVFYDPKSSESAFPYFSHGIRDDSIQRRYLQAFHEYFDPDDPDYVAGSNPASTVYSGRMVDLDNLYVYTWDARPYPAFPLDSTTWGDAANWSFGHWLTGRTGDAPLAETVKAILGDYDFDLFDTSKLSGVMDGFIIDRIMSARDALQPLELAFFFDSFESEGLIRFAPRGGEGATLTVTQDDMVEADADSELFLLERRQETELPAIAKLTYIDATSDYRQAAVEARRLTVESERVATAQLPLVLDQSTAASIVESWLHDSWTSRERAKFALAPSKLRIEPSDVLTLQTSNGDTDYRITELTEQGSRQLSALSIEAGILGLGRAPERSTTVSSPSVFGQAVAAFLDLPLLRGDEDPNVGYVAAYQSPWPGAVAFYRSPEGTGYALNVLATALATIGTTETDLNSGPTSRWDKSTQLRVRLDHGELQSVSRLSLFGGSNVVAVRNADGEWEVLQFLNAELVAENSYELSMLLRSQGGTESAMRDPVASGAQFVLLDQAVVPVAMSADEINLQFNWSYGPANRDLGQPSYQTLVKAFSGVGLRTLSPVHVRGQFAGNDLVISWIRRTRLAGDSWDVTEVPLGEEEERYEVDILDSGTVKRTLGSSTSTVTYSEADQIDDWGTVQAAYDIRVYQLNSSLSRGSPREATING